MGSCKMSDGVMRLCLSAALLLMTMTAGGVAAQAPAPSPAAVDCPTVVLTLTDCLSFVMGAAKTPPAACCTELSAVITNNPQCLCLLFNTTFTEPLGVNVTLAQQLPPACKLQTPPTSLCNLLGVPVPGPVSSTSPGMAPSSAMTPMSTTVPTIAPASGPATATSPSGPAMSTSPSGPASSTSASTAPAPSSAPSISSWSMAISASFFLLASILLS